MGVPENLLATLRDAAHQFDGFFQAALHKSEPGDVVGTAEGFGVLKPKRLLAEVEHSFIETIGFAEFVLDSICGGKGVHQGDGCFVLASVEPFTLIEKLFK